MLTTIQTFFYELEKLELHTITYDLDLSENYHVHKQENTLMRIHPSVKIEYGSIVYRTCFLTQNREYFLSHDISSLPLEFIERLGELQEGEHTDNVGSVIVHLQRVVQSAEEYIWLMADHRLGNQEYVTKSGKLESNSRITWRVILPASSSINWAEVRRTAGIHKGR